MMGDAWNKGFDDHFAGVSLSIALTHARPDFSYQVEMGLMTQAEADRQMGLLERRCGGQPDV